MISFYTLPSTVIGNTTYSTLKAAYSFYNVATVTPLNVLMQDALIKANQVHPQPSPEHFVLNACS